MNQLIVRPKKSFAPSWLVVTALILFLPMAVSVLAQDRWLLVFENSAAMKKRMPAVGLEIQQLFFTSMGSQIHSGDSLGVWTFDQKLHVGEFPLSTWQPELAADNATNLISFLNKRSFKGEVNFNALEPVLSEVVAGSARLTVLIFCEGQGDIIWTPYNDGINQTLRQNYAERKKNNQPFVILLRVQNGKYFGCSVNFPPGGVNFPIFPELPKEAPPVPPIVTAPPPKVEPVDNTPLVMVGKAVVTNLPPKVATNVSVATPQNLATNGLTNVDALILVGTPAAAKTETTNLNLTNVVAEKIIAQNLIPETSQKPATDNSNRLLILTGILALISAVMLGVFLVVRARQPRGSLITDSMNAPRSPPRKK